MRPARRDPKEIDAQTSALLAAGQTWTYATLRAGAAYMARRLCRFSPGVPIAITMANTGEVVATLLAAETTGHPALLLPPSLSWDETCATLEASGVRPEVIRDDRPIRARGDATPYPLPHLELPTDAFIGQLTSGSLGASRIAIRSREGVGSEIAAIVDRLCLQAQDRVLCTSSIAHSYGLIGGLLAALSVGATVVLAGGTDDVVRLADQAKPTIVFGLASTYQTLLVTAQRNSLSQVRVALSAGAPLPAGLFDAFLKRFGIPIRQDYGTTETGTITIDMSEPVAPDTVGRPLPHVVVGVLPAADGRLAKAEICVRSRATAVGYLTDGKLISCVGEDGWYRTGDEGSIDRVGRLRVGQRLRPPIRIGDRLVFPDAVESVIQKLPGVEEVVVLQQGSGGQEGVKAVVVAPRLAPEVVTDWCRRELRPEPQPLVVEFRDRLPRSPAGKILLKYL